MSKLILADLHLHHTPLWRYEWMEKFLSHMALQYGQSEPVFLAGDVFEVRNKIDSRVSELFFNFISECKKEVVWLTGQHDSYLPGIASYKNLDKLASNLIIVDGEVYHHKPTDFWFIPFFRDINEYREALKQIPDNSFVVTHMPTKEVMFSQFNVDGEFISVKEFERFAWTYSGDIHKWEDFPESKFSYIGAPSQRDWRDKSTQGVHGILDANNKLMRMPTGCPKHIEIESEEEIPEHGQYIVRCSGHIVGSDQILDSMITKKKERSSIKIPETISKLQSAQELMDNYVDVSGVDNKETYKAEGVNFYEQSQ